MITSTTSAALLEARRAVCDGRGKEAAAVARAGLARSTEDGRCVQLLGLAWSAEGRHRAARHAFESALFLAPLWPESQLALAEIYASTKRPRDAHSLLTLLSERDDLAPEMLPRIAALFGRVGDHGAALALCRRSIELDPDCDEALFGAAFYMRRLNFAPEMIAAVLRRAVRLDPECCLYRRTLASLLASMGELSEAYDLYRAVTTHEVLCRGCLRTMVEVFDRCGDASRRDAAADRLEELEQSLSNAKAAPPTGNDPTTDRRE